MMQPIEYHREYHRLMMVENVYINLPGPQEPTPRMSGGELLHGFLAELYRAPTPEMKAFIANLCNKWNVHYKESRGMKQESGLRRFLSRIFRIFVVPKNWG